MRNTTFENCPRPIPLIAIRDFRNSYIPGMVLRTYELRDSTEVGGHPKQVEVIKEIAEIYPHFFFTTDRKAILFPQAMVETGWWERNSWRYYTKPDGY